MTRARSLLIPLLLAATLVAGGCGGLARKGSHNADATNDTSEVGGGIALPKPEETTASTATPTTARRDPTAPVPVKGPRGPANQATRVDPSGFRVVVTLDGQLRYSAKSDLKMQLDVDNVSNKPLRYDSNQTTYFQIRPASGASSPSWYNDQCDRRDSGGFEGPPVTLDPGESITLDVATYPGERSNRETCRVLTPGQYVLLGLVTWCPDEAMKDGLCDKSKAKTVVSAPVRFVLE